jgi:hypothetical protein
MEAYQDAMEGSPRVEIGASRTTPGTMAAAVVSYFNSWAFQNLAAETRRTRKNILERFRERHGDKRIALLQADHVKSMLAAKAGDTAGGQQLPKAAADAAFVPKTLKGNSFLQSRSCACQGPGRGGCRFNLEHSGAILASTIPRNTKRCE